MVELHAISPGSRSPKMSIVVYCKECGKKIRAPDGRAGRRGQCPQCKHEMLIPEVSESSPPEKFASKDPRKGSASGSDQSNSVPAPKSHPQKEGTPNRKKAPPKSQATKGKQAAHTNESGMIALPTPEEVARQAHGKQSPTPSKPTPPKSTPKRNRPAVVQVKTGIQWDSSPDPEPDKRPLYIALALIGLLVALIAGWFLSPEDSAAPSTREERQREQFKVPEKDDIWKRLREGQSKPSDS